MGTRRCSVRARSSSCPTKRRLSPKTTRPIPVATTATPTRTSSPPAGNDMSLAVMVSVDAPEPERPDSTNRVEATTRYA